MEKLYSQDFLEDNYLKPNEETVQFLLNYSKALNVYHHNSLKFETILN